MTYRIAFQTLGCRLNQMETESLASDFLRAGYRIVDFQSEADVYVINTCTVTNKADRKSRNQVYRAIRHGALTVVTGCSVNAGSFEEEPDVIRITNETKPRIFEIVDARLKKEDVSFAQALDTFSYPMPTGIFRTRGALKIQDGCDSFCTYCIIPHVRGPGRSLDPSVIVERLNDLIKAGFKEIVITGVNIGRYSHSGLTFTDLLEKLLACEGDFRLRISSLEPDGLDLAFTRLFAHPKLCPHLHLCLQSGSDSILERMGRVYRYADYKDLVLQIRKVRPDFCLTTDIIVGFPGETEEDFRHSFAAVEELAVSHVHIFPFSSRSGTPAEKMKDQISSRIKDERINRLNAVAKKEKELYRRGFVGKTLKVLSESISDEGLVAGSSEFYMSVKFSLGKKPENYLNQFFDVTITGMTIEKDDIVLKGQSGN